MIEYHRPHPFVHVVRLRGNRVIRHVAWGGALIAVGVAWLLKGQGLISEHELWLIAPALIALSGLARLAAAPNAAGVVHAVIRFAIAAYLVVVIENLGGWTLAATWPVLLIAVGAGNIAHALSGRRYAEQEPNW
jgi:hypothetical protein